MYTPRYFREYLDLVFFFSLLAMEFVPGEDLTGHFALFGLLGFAGVSWVSLPTRAATRTARARIAVALAVLVILEELSQALNPAREFSLLDLSASLAGVLAGLLASLKLVRPPRASGGRLP